jgi:hypothetical protein
VSPLPPPVVWAPRLRHHLNRFFRYMDRRKALKLARIQQTAVDWQWRREYTAWWNHVGWERGAPTPEQAWDNLMRARRSA